MSVIGIVGIVLSLFLYFFPREPVKEGPPSPPKKVTAPSAANETPFLRVIEPEQTP